MQRYEIITRRTTTEFGRVYVNADSKQEARSRAVGMLQDPDLWTARQSGDTEVLSIEAEKGGGSNGLQSTVAATDEAAG